MQGASFAWFIARRYLTAKRKQAFISLISAVSILGVTVGVMALVIALALMTGVQEELRDRIVGSSAHINVYAMTRPFDVQADRSRLMVPGVVGAAPAVQGFGLLQSSHSEVVTLKGVDPALESEVTEIGRSMITGSLDALLGRPEDAKDGIVLGADLADKLRVSVGDQVWVTTASMSPTPFGLVPRQRPVEVVGTFRVGFFQIDTAYALTSLETAAAMLNTPGPDIMQLRIADLDAAPAVRDLLQAQLGPDFQVRDWTMENSALYSALWLERVAISLTIGLIIVVAALNIVASLVLLVMEKSRDIAILRTMGAPARVIRRIFIYQGVVIGLVGTTVGTVLGLAVCFLADKYELIRLPGDVYYITHLPFRVQPFDIVLVMLSAVAICFVATLYPSRQAGRLDPAEALRNQ